MTIFDERESEIRAYCRVYPVVFDKAENARQTDEEGKEYIDFFAGAGVLNFGHNNPRMKSAVIEYMQDNGVTHSLDLHTKAKRAFIEKFVTTILQPRGMPHKLQFMGPTGTNSVEAALKIARRVTGRREIVAFTHGFHGMTLGALACTANQAFRGAAGIPLENVRHFPFGCDQPLGKGSTRTPSDIIDEFRTLYADTSSGHLPPAAFLIEPIQAEGGVNVADQQWLLDLQALARELGSLIIVDDIQVGMGRTGSFFSFDNTGLDPDVICLAKGIGGMGIPMAMNLVKPEVDKHWKPGEHTGTFRGQNLSFVAGREALTYFDDDELMSDVQCKGRQMMEAMEKLVNRYEELEVRGKGMILGLDAGNGDRSRAIVDACFKSGLIISACGTGGRVVKLIPPLTIPYEDLAEGLDILTKATEEVMEAA
jgi:diaminobutyrate-2-oxoglutarate transaminase